MAKWKKIFTPKEYNHHFWLEHGERLTLADNSAEGRNPEHTWDGPLYILVEDGMVASKSEHAECGITFDIRVLKEEGDEENEYGCSVALECAEFLVREFDMEIHVRDKKVQRMLDLFKKVGEAVC